VRDRPLDAAEFARLLDPLGPFEPRPRLAVAVSGGADSLALTLLADGWARARGGDVLGLIVDHGLRPESAAEARLTHERLAARGIAALVLTLRGLARGPALAARARAARYAALEEACAESGRVHLLLGHHAGDQAETVLMRRLSGSGPAGRAAMPALTETARVRLLRPLLTVPPVRLRATLRAAGLAWVEDPSNADPATLRARLRIARADPDGTGPATAALVASAATAGVARAAAEHAAAAVLARRVAIYPEGYALLTPGPLPAMALGALLRVLGGADWAPAPAQVARLAASPRPATLGGVRLMAAGRLAPPGVWLMLREAAAMAPPVPARPGACWDGRFRLAADAGLPAGLAFGAVGAAAARLRRISHLPAAVLRTLPALWQDNVLVAVPLLLYPDAAWQARCGVAFAPRAPLAGAPFAPAARRQAADRRSVGDAEAGEAPYVG
jgi:tRNA(Ile)-lysidine synthase